MFPLQNSARKELSLRFGNAYTYVGGFSHCWFRWLSPVWCQTITWYNSKQLNTTQNNIIFNKVCNWKCYLHWPQFVSWFCCSVNSSWPIDATPQHRTGPMLAHPDSKFHGANMGPIWGRQDPGGFHVGPMNFAILTAKSLLPPGTKPLLTNLNVSSVRSSNIHLRAILQEISQPPITKINLKSAHLKWHWNFQGWKS